VPDSLDSLPTPVIESSAPSSQAFKVIDWRQQWPILLVLLLAGGLSSATGTIVAPVFPEVIDQFQVGSQWAGVLVSAHTLTLALASPTLGLWADRIGGGPILVGSLLAYGLFGGLGGLSQGFWGMLWCRVLAGAAGGGIAAGAIGLLSILYASEVRSRLMGYAASVLSMATVIFPILGGWLGLYGWRWAFCLYGLGIPVALAAWLVVPTAVTPTTKTVDLSQTEGIGQLLRQRRIAALLLALGIASALFYVVVVYAPLYLKATIGASSIFNGAVLACRAIGAAMISAVGAHRLAGRIGRGSAIATGFLLMALTLGSIPHVQHPPLILLTALGFGLGFGLVMPNFYNALADRSPLRQRTGILAIGTGAASLGQFISPLLFGPVWTLGGIGVFYVAASVAATIGILYWLIGYWKWHCHGLP